MPSRARRKPAGAHLGDFRCWVAENRRCPLSGPENGFHRAARSAIFALAIFAAVSPAVAGQSGIAGHCNAARCETIVWGGVGWIEPGVNGDPYPIYIYGPGGLLHTVTTADSYFQFPMQAIGPGQVYWTTQAPADGLTAGPSITVQTSPPVGAYWPPGYTPLPQGAGPSLADKDEYENMAAADELAAAASGFLTIATAATPVVIATSIVTAGFLASSFAFQILAADPPDPKFDQIATPASETPMIRMPAGAPACHQTMANQIASALGLFKAAEVTVNRISGAWKAHSATWTSRQQSWFLQLRAKIPAAHAALTAALAHWATTCAPKHAPVTAAAVLAAERKWLSRGFPSWLSDAVTQLGLSQYDAEQVLIPASAKAVAGFINGGFR